MPTRVVSTRPQNSSPPAHLQYKIKQSAREQVSYHLPVDCTHMQHHTPLREIIWGKHGVHTTNAAGMTWHVPSEEEEDDEVVVTCGELQFERLCTPSGDEGAAAPSHAAQRDQSSLTVDVATAALPPNLRGRPVAISLRRRRRRRRLSSRVAGYHWQHSAWRHRPENSRTIDQGHSKTDPDWIRPGSRRPRALPPYTWWSAHSARIDRPGTYLNTLA